VRRVYALSVPYFTRLKTDAATAGALDRIVLRLAPTLEGAKVLRHRAGSQRIIGGTAQPL